MLMGLIKLVIIIDIKRIDTMSCKLTGTQSVTCSRT